jgi:hypothetical protein
MQIKTSERNSMQHIKKLMTCEAALFSQNHFIKMDAKTEIEEKIQNTMTSFADRNENF